MADHDCSDTCGCHDTFGPHHYHDGEPVDMPSPVWAFWVFWVSVYAVVDLVTRN